MATQADIQINGSPGSNTDLPLDTVVNLTNNGAGGETTWEWTLLSQPAGAQDNFADSGTLVSTLAAPQFTPKKEGSYLIRLIVNKGLAEEKTDQAIGAVLELQTGNRIPAALETTEVDATSGWAYTAVNDILQRVTRQTDAGTFVCIAGENIAPGDVVHMTEMATIASGLPGERQIPKVNKALASDLNKVDGPLGIMVGQKDGDYLPVLSGEYCRVMVLGGLSQITLAGGPGVAGDSVYVDDSGAMSLTPGTYVRQVGDVAKVYAGPKYDVAIAAVANSIPRGNAGGDLAGYFPNPTIALGAVTENKIATDAVTENKIANNAVTSNKIAPLSIVESQITTGAVTESKIGSGAVTVNKIGAGAVTPAKLSPEFYQVARVSPATVNSTTDVSILSLSGIVLTGGLIRISLQPRAQLPGDPAYGIQFNATNATGTDYLAYVTVYVTGTVERTYRYIPFVMKQSVVNLPYFNIVDALGPGTYNVNMTVYAANAAVTIYCDDMQMVVQSS